MKKLALTIVCALAVTGAAFGQENLVTFSPARTAITAQTNATVYSPLFGGGAAGGTIGPMTTPATSLGLNYDFTLLYQTQSGYQVLATDTSVWDGTWKDTGLTATNSGSFSGQGALSPVGPTATTVPWVTGVTNSIVMVGWSANLGTTWTGVSNILAQLALGNTAPLIAQVGSAEAFFGESTFGYISPNTTPSPGASIFGTGAASVNGQPIYSLLTPLYLLPVPEPASLALAGLGGLSMLLFRRQRK
jgi:hypothetical protein